jgi:hypothetical protein
MLELGELALVKIDTERFELFTLRGLEPQLLLQRIRGLVVEISPILLKHDQHTPADIYNLLASHGYRPKIGPPQERQWDELFEADNSRKGDENQERRPTSQKTY